MIEISRERAFFEQDPMFDKYLEEKYREALEDVAEFEINMDDFIDLYGKVAEEKDKRYVADKEKDFLESSTPQQEKSKKLATIFEVIVDQQIELNEWLGENAYTIKTSKYDDYYNGVDTVIEFDRDEGISHMAFAVDVTYSQNRVAAKIQRILKNIETGDLAKVKYFYSENMNFRGEVKNIPKLIVGADIDTIKDMLRLMDEGKKNELKNHKAKYQMVEMMRMQLEAYRDYAVKRGQKGVEKIFQNFLNIINNIIE